MDKIELRPKYDGFLYDKIPDSERPTHEIDGAVSLNVHYYYNSTSAMPHKFRVLNLSAQGETKTQAWDRMRSLLARYDLRD